MASVKPATASATGVGTAASHPYTCNSCQVAYRNIDLQKTHMKSDWHRYNLKRRVASLPPISSEVFTEKVLQARAASTAETDKAYFERSCDTCVKTYYSQNAYQNHLLSQKHKLKESTGDPRPEDEATSVVSSTFSLGEPTSIPKGRVDSDAEDEFNHVIESLQNANMNQQRPSPVKRPGHPRPDVQSSTNGDGADALADNTGSEEVPATQSVTDPAWTPQSCIFCNYESPSLSLNAHHMERFHGMFIPEKSYLVDLEGLVKQLQRQVSKYHQCLSCTKMTSSVFAVQTHMRDKGHCKIPYTTEDDQLLIGNFYDFRSTYSDGEEDASDDGSTEDERGGAKLGARRSAKVTDLDGNAVEAGDGDADGWETDSSESSLDSNDLTAVPAEGHIHQFERLDKHPHHSSHDPRQRHQLDGWHSRAHKHTHAAFYDEYELHLPSGKSVGHRSLNKYYRQNLNSYPTPEERAERQALEASAHHDSDTEGDVPVPTGNNHGRSLVPRGAMGLVGVSDEKKQKVRKAEQRGRSLEKHRTKRNEMAYGLKLNNHKSYYYREQGGG